MKIRTNLKRIVKIGNKLVQGPSAIFRLSQGDWLEKDLYITIRGEGFKNISTFSLWTDSSMNKEEDFLSPMIRILNWNRQQDLEAARIDENRNFPNIDLKLGTIKSSKFDDLENAFISIQKAVKENNEYVPYKIATERDCAKLTTDYENDYLDFRIYIRNGSQSLELSSVANYSSHLVQEIQRIIKLFKESIELVDKTKWKERYYELTKEYLEGEIPEWYYDNELRKAKS